MTLHFGPSDRVFTPNGRRNVRSELPSVLLRSIVEAIDVNLTLERFVQRDVGLCGRNARNGQNPVAERRHQVLVVDAVQFHEKVVRPRDEMALHDFGKSV